MNTSLNTTIVRAGALAASLAAACGGSKGEKSGPIATNLSEFCVALATTLCDAQERCCMQEEPCDVQAQEAACRTGLEPVLESGLARFDRASAERVLDGYAGWSDRCEVRLFEVAGVAAVNGTVPSGGECTDGEGEPLAAACAPDTTCDTAASTPRCVALPSPKLRSLACRERGNAQLA